MSAAVVNAAPMNADPLVREPLIRPRKPAAPKAQRVKKPLPPKRFEVDPELPPLAQAASLVLAVLGATKAETVNRLAAILAAAECAEHTDTVAALASIELSDEQESLLLDPEFAGVLGYLWAKPGSTGSDLGISVCRGCGCWALSYSTPAGSCRVTTGCGGRTVNSTRAKTAKPPPDPPEPDLRPAVPDDPGHKVVAEGDISWCVS